MLPKVPQPFPARGKTAYAQIRPARYINNIQWGPKVFENVFVFVRLLEEQLLSCHYLMPQNPFLGLWC